jgi:hypothetical protein
LFEERLVLVARGEGEQKLVGSRLVSPGQGIGNPREFTRHALINE